MVFSVGEMAIRVVLVLITAFILTCGTVLVVKWIKIDIKDFNQRTGPKFMLIGLFANLLFIIAVQLLLNLLDQHNLDVLGLTFSQKDLIYSLLAFLLTFITAFIFIFCLNHVTNKPIQWESPKTFEKGEGFSILFALIVLFVAALQEEVMFRGYIQFLFQGRSTMTSMLVSTVIFTVWHFIGNKVHLYQTIDWLFGGLLLFFVYSESGSLWAAAIVHFSRNFSNVLLFNIARKHCLLKWEQPILPKYKTFYTTICSIIIASLTYFIYG